MNRFEKLFAQQKAFVGYLTTGHKGLEDSLQAAQALIAGGVNLLEIGVPFSDPTADGPVIEAAMEEALANGTRLADAIELGRQLRQQYPDLPLVLFSYFNPLFKALDQDILRNLNRAGFDGLLIVDLNIDEANDFIAQCQTKHLASIFVVTPDTDKERFAAINDKASGFIYYACRKGTTGIKKDLPEDFELRINQLKSQTNLPIVAGFGIADREAATKVLKHANGFVVGSKFVDAISRGISFDGLRELAASLRP